MSYDCRIYPAEAHAGYRPSAPVLAAVIHGLVDDRWIEPTAKGSFQAIFLDGEGSPTKRPLRVSELEADLETLSNDARHFGLRFWNRRHLGDDETPFEADSDGMFRAAYCEDIYIVSSEVFLGFTDEQGSEDHISCPSCGNNVLADWDAHPDTRLRKMHVVLRAHKYVPAECPECHATVDQSRLTMRLRRVADERGPRIEAAPCYKFGLWLAPGDDRYPVDADHITLDPRLCQILETTCGVPFRSIGRLS